MQKHPDKAKVSFAGSPEKMLELKKHLAKVQKMHRVEKERIENRERDIKMTDAVQLPPQPYQKSLKKTSTRKVDVKVMWRDAKSDPELDNF